ncbi:MAG: DUF433 domain-containing protein [Scytonematopsis contorta HA4267-MV1]|jgi:uncharacterized protein (DUF433 family)|nr:DUF433 domain-containing protein [Scytonematopsis contorta HA4267-MV1]
METNLNNIYLGTDPRLIGNYTLSDVTRYLRLPYSTLRSWVVGSKYKTRLGVKRFQPVIELPQLDNNKILLSFTNLVELHALNAIRRYHQIPLESVREGIEYLKQNCQMRHPLASHQLYTDGKDLFLVNSGLVVNLSQQGQLLIPEIIKIYLQRIEWDETGLPIKLYPFTRPEESESPLSVVIDPFVSFGQPVITGTGVPTKTIAERYKAGDSINDLSLDYECEPSKVEEAIRYELAIAA